jgi:nitrogen fixation protein NifQ
MNARLKQISYGWLLARAKKPEDELTRVFASVIQSIAQGAIQPPNLGMGLDYDQFSELLDGYFPGGSAEIWDAGFQAEYSACVSPLASEFEDIVNILLEHRSHDTRQNEWLAYAVASGCMGSDHLYHDMGLPDRGTLSALLERYFTALFRKNVHNMKWKKFFYKQLCDRAEIIMCPTRNCNSCVDYHHCYTPEGIEPAMAKAA